MEKEIKTEAKRREKNAETYEEMESKKLVQKISRERQRETHIKVKDMKKTHKRWS